MGQCSCTQTRVGTQVPLSSKSFVSPDADEQTCVTIISTYISFIVYIQYDLHIYFSFIVYYSRNLHQPNVLLLDQGLLSDGKELSSALTRYYGKTFPLIFLVIFIVSFISIRTDVLLYRGELSKCPKKFCSLATVAAGWGDMGANPTTHLIFQPRRSAVCVDGVFSEPMAISVLFQQVFASKASM